MKIFMSKIMEQGSHLKKKKFFFILLLILDVTILQQKKFKNYFVKLDLKK